MYWLLAGAVLLLIKVITMLPVGLMFKVLMGLGIVIGLQAIGFVWFYKHLKQRAEAAGSQED